MSFSGGQVAITFVRFRNDGGFTIASAITEDERRITLAGVMPSLYEGDVIHVDGEWKVHPQYGEQFQVSGVRRESALPTTHKGIKQWLSSRLKWVGPTTAQRLLSKYGADLWDVIEKRPDELTEIRGLTKERVAELVLTYFAFKGEMTTRAWLYEIGLTERQADLAVKKWENVRQVIEDNPYFLMHLPGIKFIDADAVAAAFEMPKDDHRRCEAAVAQVVRERCRETGHTYIKLPVALTLAGNLTRAGHIAMMAALEHPDRIWDLTLVSNTIAPGHLYRAELIIAHRVIHGVNPDGL